MLGWPACDFKDDVSHRQEIAKDIENEVAIMQCRRRILAVVVRVAKINRHADHQVEAARAQPSSRQSGSATTSRTSGFWLKAPSGICSLRTDLRDLYQIGEVSSLAGDRVVSHERSRPADLPHDDKAYDWANSTFAAGGTTRGMKWFLQAPVSINGFCYAP
jgi:hypothetical protein